MEQYRRLENCHMGQQPPQNIRYKKQVLLVLLDEVHAAGLRATKTLSRANGRRATKVPWKRHEGLRVAMPPPSSILNPCCFAQVNKTALLGLQCSQPSWVALI